MSFFYDLNIFTPLMQFYSLKKNPQIDKRLYSNPSPSFQKYPMILPQETRNYIENPNVNSIVKKYPYKKIFKEFYLEGGGEGEGDKETPSPRNKNQRIFPFFYPFYPFSLYSSFSYDPPLNLTFPFYSTLGFFTGIFFIFTYREKIPYLFSSIKTILIKPLPITNTSFVKM